MYDLKDMIIIGGGPAGLTAGIYAARSALDIVIIEKNTPGGQLWLTEAIENYPGFPSGIGSYELAQRMEAQAKKYGADIENDEVTDIKEESGVLSVVTKSGKAYHCISIVIASGAAMKQLAIKGEKKFTGRGVSYCAVCDGPLYKEKTVAVIGGGDAACQEALFLAKFAKKILLIHRRSRLRAVKAVQEKILANAKIEIMYNKEIAEILGGEYLEMIRLKTDERIPVEGLFIFIGLNPNTGFTENILEKKDSFICTYNGLATSLKGVFAAGDCRYGALRQVVSACGEGAIAAEEARRYIETKKGSAYDR